MVWPVFAGRHVACPQLGTACICVMAAVVPSSFCNRPKREKKKKPEPQPEVDEEEEDEEANEVRVDSPLCSCLFANLLDQILKR